MEKQSNKKANKLNARLVALIQKGDKAGMAELYDCYSASLLGLIMRNIPEKPVAEEVLQDVFLKVWKNINTYNPAKSSLFTWMAQIARFTAIDKLRSKENNQAQKTDSFETLVYQEEQTSEEAAFKDYGLHKVLTQLEEKQQKIIHYIYFLGYSQSETAKAMDIPLGTVKSKVRAAIISLRKILGSEPFVYILIFLDILHQNLFK